MKRSVFVLVLVGLVVGGAWGMTFYRQHRAQQRLNVQLELLTNVLVNDNDAAGRAADRAVQDIHASVARNQNQPREMALLAAAESLEARTDSVVRTLRRRSEELLIATQNVRLRPTLPHPAETRSVARLLGNGSATQQELRQLLSGYAAALRAIRPGAAFSISEPSFEGLPAVAAFAAFARLENDVLTAEAGALRHLASQVSSTRVKWQLVAMAEAESNTVAPGEMYRARLLLTNALQLPASARVLCNGQPIPVEAGALGRVRLVAPTRPGPAAWTGTISFRTGGGRDTTFRVRVPYRVARP
jgi:hypothetical protein